MNHMFAAYNNCFGRVAPLLLHVDTSYSYSTSKEEDSCGSNHPTEMERLYGESKACAHSGITEYYQKVRNTNLIQLNIVSHCVKKERLGLTSRDAETTQRILPPIRYDNFLRRFMILQS